jgi:hypothetical protein
MGRVKIYDREAVSKQVLESMRGGLSTHKACQAAGVPQSTFAEWLDDDAKLAEQYAKARADLIERMASEILEYADAEVERGQDGKAEWAQVQKQRLQVDTRKWLLSKMAPHKYGERLELSGDPERPVAIQRIERVIVK